MIIDNFDELNNIKRINLNLSDEAIDIIQSDIIEFMHDDNKFLSSFLNVVLENFYYDANSSIHIKKKQYEKELSKIMSDDKIITILSNDFENKLISNLTTLKQESKYSTYKKETKFKLNKNNFQLISESYDVKHPYYKNKERLYLNALFEEYAKLTPALREQTFFKQYSTVLNIATLVEKCMVVITTINNKKILINPYQIITDSTNTSSYLVGTKSKDNKVIAFRLKNIINITLDKTSDIDKTNFNTIDQLIKERSIALINGELKSYKVKLTSDGINTYNKTLNMRPKVKFIENDIYTFDSTDFQMINYFIKFGENVEILEPIELRDYFIIHYKKALSIYKE